MIRVKLLVKKYEEVIWWGVGIGFIFALPIFSSQIELLGNDWFQIYRPATISDNYLIAGLTANPLYVLFIFWPLAQLPATVGYFTLILINILAFRLIAHLSGINKWLIFPSFPSLWMLIYAQIDVLVALGVIIGWWAIKNNRPNWQGCATVLLFLKPHIGGALALVYLFWQKDKRSFIVIGIVGAASLFAFGILWPIEWVTYLFAEVINAANISGFNDDRNAWNNIGLFPYGLLSWLLVLLPYPRKYKIPAIISASILSVPYAGAYSLLAIMAVQLPIWVYPILSLPLVHPLGYTLIIIAPIAMVTYPVIKYLVLPRIQTWHLPL